VGFRQCLRYWTQDTFRLRTSMYYTP
jgi:hypothetical protein